MLRRALAFVVLVGCSSFSSGATPTDTDGGVVSGNDDGGPTQGPVDSGSSVPPSFGAPKKLADLSETPVAIAAGGTRVAVFSAKHGRLFASGVEQPDWYTTTDTVTGPAFAAGASIFFRVTNNIRSCDVDSKCMPSDDLKVGGMPSQLAVTTDAFAFAQFAGKKLIGYCPLAGCTSADTAKNFEPTVEVTALAISSSFVFFGTRDGISTLERKGTTPDAAALYSGTGVTAMTTTNGVLYFSDGKRILSCPAVRDSCKPTVVVDGVRLNPVQLTVRGGIIFWLEPDIGKVFATPVTGGGVVTDVATLTGLIGFAVSDALYLATDVALWRADPIASTP